MNLFHIFCYEVFLIGGDLATLSLGLDVLVLSRIVGCATTSQGCMIMWCLIVATGCSSDCTIECVSEFSAFFVNGLKNKVFNHIIIIVALFWFFKLRLG